MTSSPISEGVPAVTAEDVTAAAALLAGKAVLTPLLESEALNALAGGRVLIKAESLQHTGSFKYRGAYNRLARLSPEERGRGVVAYSSGNHGQAIAAVAQLLGIGATVVMPADAPSVKLSGVRRRGAAVVTYDRATEEREAVAARISEETGATIVPPYDHPLIIAGQGTIGLEIAEQAAEAGVRPSAVLVPCSGGGLIAGCATAIRDRWADAEVYSVEPAGFDDTARSLASGRRERAIPGAETICDALRVPMPGEITFGINRSLLTGGFAVDDRDALGAMAAAFHHLKLVVEPGGAVALAAVLTKRYHCRGRSVVVVCSGGNVDQETFVQALRVKS